MLIYEFENYKTILRESLLEKKSVAGARYTFARMARACNVQKTYLSKVLNGDGHLSTDQLFLACDFLGLTRDERQYVGYLLERERSGVRKRRDELTSLISAVQTRFRKTSEYLAAKPLPAPATDHAEYYLDPHLQVIHMFLTIEKYASDLRKITADLGWEESHVLEAVKRLQAMGLISLNEGRYHVNKPALHLPDDSPLYPPYRVLMRVKALDQIQRPVGERPYCFSVIFSSNRETRNAIHARFLRFIKSVEGLVQHSPTEEVFQMNFDLFQWMG